MKSSISFKSSSSSKSSGSKLKSPVDKTKHVPPKLAKGHPTKAKDGVQVPPFKRPQPSPSKAGARPAHAPFTKKKGEA